MHAPLRTRAPRHPRRRLAPAALAAALLGLAAPAARAQAFAGTSFAALFPPDTTAPGTAPGVTVLSRARPLYTPLGLRLGLLEARPRLNVGLGYDSNPTGLPHGAGGLVLRTAPALSLGAGWGQSGFGIDLGLDDRRVPGVPTADRTDWTAAAGLRLQLGPDQLRLAVAARALHEDGSQIGALPTDRPLPYRVTALSAAWRFGGGQLSLTPALGLATWRYDPASLGGVTVPQRYRDRDVIQGEITARYALAPRTDLVLVVRGTGSHYVAPQPEAASRDSTGISVLTGAEGGDGVLHLRLLAGWEQRRFAATTYGTHAAPIAELQAVWQPSAMTTLTATFSRRIEDAAQEGVAGYTETAIRLRLDREVRRNLLVSIEAGLQQADFTQNGGHETGTRAAISATWLLNRWLHLSAAETLTQLHATNNVARSLSLITLGLGW